MFSIDPLRDKRWPELVERHSLSSVFHSVEWLSALRSTYGYEPVVYTKSGASADLASGLVFCKVKSWLTGSRLVSLPFSDHCDPLVENFAELDEVLLSVRQTVDAEKWDYCEVRPFRFGPEVAAALGPSEQYNFHAIDLKPDIDSILRCFHSSAQRKILRAKREALSHEEGNSPRLLGHFYRLLIATRKRHELPPQPIKWFQNLMASFGGKLRIRVAYREGQAIASILTLSHKNTVTYKYGCSDARFHPLGGVALLFRNMIRQAKTEGYEVVDLGRSDRVNEGLSAFKEHWGGVRYDLSYWRYPNHPRVHESSWKKRVVRSIVKAAPDRMLAMAGDMFYQHMG